MKDKFDIEMKVGQFVAYVGIDYRQAKMSCGVLTGFTKKGRFQVLVIEKRYNFDRTLKKGTYGYGFRKTTWSKPINCIVMGFPEEHLKGNTDTEWIYLKKIQDALLTDGSLDEILKKYQTAKTLIDL